MIINFSCYTEYSNTRGYHKETGPYEFLVLVSSLVLLLHVTSPGIAGCQALHVSYTKFNYHAVTLLFQIRTKANMKLCAELRKSAMETPECFCRFMSRTQ